MQKQTSWEIIYNNFSGMERHAVEFLNKEMGQYVLRQLGEYSIHVLPINKETENYQIEKSAIVISLYKDQVNMLKKEVNKMSFKNINFNKSKVSSVDEFQGKEEDIIIVNLVRNNKSKGVSDFVKKLERINVALSRARKMLIVVGAKSFFTRLDIEMESLDDATIRYTKKLYNEIYNRIEGKIKDPYSYF